MPPGPKKRGKNAPRGKGKFSDGGNIGYDNIGRDGSHPKEEASGEEMGATGGFSGGEIGATGGFSGGEMGATGGFSEAGPSNDRYARRKIHSNWERYEERSPGPYEDTTRGEKFEVFLSYQSGSAAHLKLKEEKQWASAAVDLQNGLYLDCEKLALSLKAIPFHERLHLPQTYFTCGMIRKFKEVAARNDPVGLGASALVPDAKREKAVWCPSYSNPPKEKSEEKETGRSYALKYDLSRKSSFARDQTSLICPTPKCEVPDTSSKSKVLEEDTEDIISKLDQFLSLHDRSQQRASAASAAPTSLPSDVKYEDDPIQDEDLAALLLLSRLDKSPDEKEPQSSAANIEDWLTTLLTK